jgi:uncharacterized protein DUF1259
MSKPSRTLLVLLGLSFVAGIGHADEAQPWVSIDEVFGLTGKVLPGDVHKYSWPRTDLKVIVDGVQVEAGLALGSWAGFIRAGSAGHVMAMGDLMLLSSEVNPVIRALQDGGVEVIALHNHLLGESPQIMALHFSGHGDAEKVARALKSAVEKTATPAPKSAPAPPTLTTAEAAAFDKIQTVLGRKGSVSGHVLQIGAARSAKIEEGGVEIPPTMGMNNPLNFQVVGERAATTGDFVLIADEVTPVIRELESHGIQVAALHSHMLRESPRLFFMHFWGLDDPAKIAEGLKAALGKVAVQ